MVQDAIGVAGSFGAGLPGWQRYTTGAGDFGEAKVGKGRYITGATATAPTCVGLGLVASLHKGKEFALLVGAVGTVAGCD